MTADNPASQRLPAKPEYLFTVAAGILPAVEPGILPGGNGVLSEKALAIWRLGPAGKMPPSTAAKLAAATYLLSTVKTYRVPNGNSGFPVSITHISLLTDQRNNL